MQNLISLGHKTNVSDNPRLIQDFNQDAIFFSDGAVQISVFNGVGRRILSLAKHTEQRGEMERRTRIM